MRNNVRMKKTINQGINELTNRRFSAMKRRIQVFEQIEGKRCVDVRRVHNELVLGTHDLFYGGAKLGEGLEKCVYDSNTGLACPHKKLPRLTPDTVNVVLSQEAFDKEHQVAHSISSKIGSTQPKIMVTLDQKPICHDLKPPPNCERAKVHNAESRVLVRAPKVGTSKIFESLPDLGRALLNLVFALHLLHKHDTVHADIKIHKRADNVVRHESVYKLIDFGLSMTFNEFQKALHTPHTPHTSHITRTDLHDRFLRFRNYMYWPISHIYYMMDPLVVEQLCRTQHIQVQDVQRYLFMNFDVVGLVQSIKVLASANPTFHLHKLLKQFVPKTLTKVQKVVRACTEQTLKRNMASRHKSHIETYIPLPEMYKKIHTFTKVKAPPTIEEYQHNIES